MSTTSSSPMDKFHLAGNRRSYMAAVLVCSDLLALMSAVAIGLMLKTLINRPVDLTGYLRLWPFFLVFTFVFFLEGLYSGIALSPPQELRRVTVSSAVIYLFLAGVTISLRGGHTLFTWLLLVTIVLSVTFIPLFRAIVRRRFGDRDWWGYPAIIFGTGAPARRAIRTMLAEPWLGLHPVPVVDDEPAELSMEGVAVIRTEQLDREISLQFKRFYGVQALSEQLPAELKAMIERNSDAFSHLLVIPDMPGFSTLWVNPRSFGRMLSLETHQQVMAAPRRIAKRAMDIVLSSLTVVLVLPLMAAIAAWVALDSPGPIIFGSARLGQRARPFLAWKFRSMILNGDEVLATYLQGHPEARIEWESTQKLRCDPRITRAGRFLRRSSLDELPQLWNVLRGEMSLVGPRPIGSQEVSRYGNDFCLYSKVPGGVTGLWQVSGRNNTTYAERVSLDIFYVRNWSVWLDLCILFQTIGVVIARRGAY